VAKRKDSIRNTFENFGSDSSSDKENLLIDDCKVLKDIGSGQFGTVYLI